MRGECFYYFIFFIFEQMKSPDAEVDFANCQLLTPSELLLLCHLLSLLFTLKLYFGLTVDS